MSGLSPSLGQTLVSVLEVGLFLDPVARDLMLGLGLYPIPPLGVETLPFSFSPVALYLHLCSTSHRAIALPPVFARKIGVWSNTFSQSQVYSFRPVLNHGGRFSLVSYLVPNLSECLVEVYRELLSGVVGP